MAFVFSIVVFFIMPPTPKRIGLGPSVVRYALHMVKNG